MSRSPADAVNRAVERSQQLLFPFNANKWFALGFTVFLARCGEGSGGLSLPNIPSPGSSLGSSGGSGASGMVAELQRMLTELNATVHRDLALYGTLAVVGTLLVIGLWLLVLWASSRAKLMLVESVIWDRVNLSEQWSRAADLGWSLTRFRLLFGSLTAVLVFGAFAGGVMVALPDLKLGIFFGPRAILGYAIMGGATLLVVLPMAIALSLLDDFVVPLMVIRNLRVGQAWAVCRDEVLSAHWGAVVLFYVLKIVLGFGIGIVLMVLSCVTCCLTSLPYVGTVLQLPVWVFLRAYSLYFLETLGISVFPAPVPTWAAYEAWRFPR